MARVMLLVSGAGATIGETRLESPAEDVAAESMLRVEAYDAGFTKEEVEGAHVVIVGDF